MYIKMSLVGTITRMSIITKMHVLVITKKILSGVVFTYSGAKDQDKY